MATGSTPVRGRPYPLETDAPDVAADMHTLALNLDQVPNLTSGTTLPVSGMMRGDEFLLTTTSVWYKYSGSSWQAIPGVGDSGWTALTLGTNVTSLGGGFYAPQARQIGDMVFLRGQMDSTGAISTGATLFTTPFHPASKDILVLSFNATILIGVLTTTGAVTLDGTISGAGSSFGVGGLSYSII